mgnify:CR=1 FL=1
MSCPQLGSPPRVRGKEQAENLDGVDMRITPACAGKSYRGAEHFKEIEDHPRVCGEKSEEVFK